MSGRVRPTVAHASARTAGRAVRIEVVSDPAALPAMEQDWCALEERCHPHQLFQGHTFLSLWVRHYLAAGDRLAVITARLNGRLVMLWPLVQRRRLGVSRLTFMGAPVAQFSDVLLDTGEDVETLLRAGWATITRMHVDVFEARRVRADSALLSVPPRGPILVEADAAPFADLTRRVAGDEPGEAYSPRERSSRRRRLKRLAERGEVLFREHEPGADAVRLALEAVAMKRRSLAARGVVSPSVADPRFEAFFRDLAGCPGSPLRVVALACGGRTVGIDLSLDCRGTSFGHVLATDPDFDREGLGGLLVPEVFSAARGRGSTVFDMLAPADPYKLHHADGETAVQDLAFAFSRRGRLYAELGLKRLRPLARATARRVPARLLAALLPADARPNSS